MMRSIDEIEAAFLRVKSSAEKAMEGGEDDKDRSFQDIFALNNEIGRLARQKPETMPKMRELQIYVNMITVGIKYGRMAEMREGISSTEGSIKAIKKEFSAGP